MKINDISELQIGDVFEGGYGNSWWLCQIINLNSEFKPSPGRVVKSIQTRCLNGYFEGSEKPATGRILDFGLPYFQTRIDKGIFKVDR